MLILLSVFYANPYLLKNINYLIDFILHLRTKEMVFIQPQAMPPWTRVRDQLPELYLLWQNGTWHLSDNDVILDLTWQETVDRLQLMCSST